MEFQDRNAGEEEFSQAIIENLFLLKDGSVVMGCHVVCGTVHRGDRFYYVDCVGRECFAVTVADIAVPKVGSVEKVSAEESDAYFHSRPLDSRIGAWASPQSQVIAGRSVLVTNAAKYGAQFLLNPPRPPHWGGYRLVPEQWEFWQGRKSRLHDRLRYRPEESAPADAWVRERLAP